MSAPRPRGIELRRPWGSRTSTLVCTHGHATEVPTEGAPTTCPVCDLVSADEAQGLLDAATSPNAECTGVAAGWCPVHGDCTCAVDREDSTCPLHAATSTHAEGDAEALRDRAEVLARTVVALHARLDVLPMLLRGAAGEREGLPYAATTDAEVDAAIATLRASGVKRFRLEWLDAGDQPVRTATPEEDRAHLVIYQTALARAHRGLDALAERDALRAIIEGRGEPPTDTEILAHCADGGAWVIGHAEGGGTVISHESGLALEVARRHRRHPGQRWVWHAFDSTGRPCAWPVVPNGIGGCPVCRIANRDGSCDCGSFCADCATLEGKAANDPDTCYPARCPKHQGAP